MYKPPSRGRWPWAFRDADPELEACAVAAGQRDTERDAERDTERRRERQRERERHTERA